MDCFNLSLGALPIKSLKRKNQPLTLSWIQYIFINATQECLRSTLQHSPRKHGGHLLAIKLGDSQSIKLRLWKSSAPLRSARFRLLPCISNWRIMHCFPFLVFCFSTLSIPMQCATLLQSDATFSCLSACITLHSMASVVSLRRPAYGLSNGLWITETGSSDRQLQASLCWP